MATIKNLHGEVIYEYPGDNLQRARLNGARLYEADLRGANLQGADLQGANLYAADLFRANLSGANLRGASFHGADLRGVDFFGADLRGASFQRADLQGADLQEVDFFGADLFGANLLGAENVPYIPLACPSHGEFTGWKKVNGMLIKLLIPENAKRLSATSRKCRCDMAKVLDIISLDGARHYKTAISRNYALLTYKVGEMVFPDSFDEDRFNECAHGIHFFIDRQDAIDY